MPTVRPRLNGRALPARTAASRTLSAIAAPLAAARRLFSRRRILAVTGSFSLIAAAFASGIAARLRPPMPLARRYA